MEKKLLILLFQTLDRMESNYPYIVDITLQKISSLYNKDIIDTTNCYLNYAWSNIDQTDKDTILDNYI